MAEYRYLVGSIWGGAVYEEMPFSSVTYGHVLNRPGAFSATIGLRHAKATRANLDPGRTAIHVERDGLIVWSGILWTVRASVTDSTLEVAGEGWWSYFRRRVIDTDKTYVATDQLTIARDLVTYALSTVNSNIGVLVGTETSGVTRDRTYFRYQMKNLGEAVEELAAVQGGFDFDISAAYEAGAIVKRFRPFHPRKGTLTPLVFELGVNLEALTQQVDAKRQANHVIATGDGEGVAMLIAEKDIQDTGVYPRLQEVTSYRSVAIPSTLQAHADLRHINRRRPVSLVPMVTAHQHHPDTGYGAYAVGDTVTVRGTDGWLSINAPMRVQEVTVSVSEESAEQLAVAFVPEDASL